MLRAMTTKSLSRRGFLWNAAGGISIAAVMQLLDEAGLLAQGTAAGKVNPQEIFKRAVDDAIGEGEVGLQFAVYKDNKLVVTVDIGGKPEKVEGTYKLDGNKLSIAITFMGKEEKDEITITKLTDEEMEAESKGKGDAKVKKETLKRVK